MIEKTKEQAAGNISPWQDLADAIVKVAAWDLRAALRRVEMHPHDHHARSVIKDVESFFRSQWFVTLTDCDGKHILRRLEEDF